MDKRLLALTLVAGAGALGFWLAVTFITFGESDPRDGAVAPTAAVTPRVDLERQFAQPKYPGTPEYDSTFSVEAAKEFDRFPLYWVGEEFQGLPLTGISRSYRPHLFPPEDDVVFLYGESCTPGGGCSIPLQILVEPYCYTQPGMIASEAKEGEVFKVRGADAQYISSGLRLWMGSVSVRIGAAPERMEAVAQALVTANALEATAAGAAFPELHTDCSNFTLEPYLGE